MHTYAYAHVRVYQKVIFRHFGPKITPFGVSTIPFRVTMHSYLPIFKSACTHARMHIKLAI